MFEGLHSMLLAGLSYFDPLVNPVIKVTNFVDDVIRTYGLKPKWFIWIFLLSFRAVHYTNANNTATSRWYSPPSFSFAWISYWFIHILRCLKNNTDKFLPENDEDVIIAQTTKEEYLYINNWSAERLFKDHDFWMSKQAKKDTELLLQGCKGVKTTDLKIAPNPFSESRLKAGYAIHIYRQAPPDPDVTGIDGMIYLVSFVITTLQIFLAVRSFLLFEERDGLVIVSAGIVFSTLHYNMPQWGNEKRPFKKLGANDPKKEVILTSMKENRAMLVLGGEGDADLLSWAAQKWKKPLDHETLFGLFQSMTSWTVIGAAVYRASQNLDWTVFGIAILGEIYNQWTNTRPVTPRSAGIRLVYERTFAKPYFFDALSELKEHHRDAAMILIDVLVDMSIAESAKTPKLEEVD